MTKVTPTSISDMIFSKVVGEVVLTVKTLPNMHFFRHLYLMPSYPLMNPNITFLNYSLYIQIILSIIYS